MPHPSLHDQLAEYKQLVDGDIAQYAAHVRQATAAQYGTQSAVVSGAFLDLLERGGKRLRGALVIAGYEMLGGSDRQMIVRAATAIEMVHTHLLILDDIQDRSAIRRGKPTVHEMLAAHYRTGPLHSDDPRHLGMSLALNALFGGNAAAQMLLAGLNVDPELKASALGIVNHTIGVTAHGQTHDIINEVSGAVTYEDIDQVMEWKTATYTILNPLCVGMVLAGAPCEDTNAIRDYALHTGKAFQITDDIIGTFGTDAQTGKSVMDDLREGKQTLLTVYALEHAAPTDQAYLRSCLGNADLTLAEHRRCQRILTDSGALQFAEHEAAQHVQVALGSLKRAPEHWRAAQVQFLEGLAESLTARTA